MILLTFKWFELPVSVKVHMGKQNHHESFNIVNLIQRTWLHGWRSCWGAKWNSEATWELVIAGGSYHQDGAATQAAQRKLERWSRWYPTGVGVIEDVQSVQGSRVREGGHLTFPFSPLPLKGKPVDKPTWEISYLNIEKGQIRDVRANILHQHTALAINLWTFL